MIRHGEKNGDSLTPHGVTACKELAERIGAFTRAYASERHRAIRTAELVSKLPVIVDARANVPNFHDNVLRGLAKTQKTHQLGIIGAIWENNSLINNAREAGVRMQGLIEEVMKSLSDDERALIVSHDGTMIGLEKILRNKSFDTVDHSFGPLEGFTIDQNLNVRNFH